MALCLVLTYTFVGQKLFGPSEDSLPLVHEGDFDKVEFLEGDKLVLAKGFSMIGGRYLVNRFYKEVPKRDSDKTRKVFVGFDYYNLDNQNHKTTVNVLEYVRKMGEDNYISVLSSNKIGPKVYSNTEYIEYGKPNLPDNNQWIYYNLKLGEYYNPSESDEMGEDGYGGPILFSTNFMQIAFERGYYFNNRFRSLTISDKDKAKSFDINIISENREIKTKLFSEGYTLYLRYGHFTNRELFDTLYHWFAPAGEETLTGLKLDSDFSIDGQEREIHSYDDFKQYYNGKGGDLDD